MAISVNEQIGLTCSACATRFTSELWTILDASEHPELAHALLDGQLDLAVCPNCGTANQAQVALLYHDADQRRVHFAVPAGAAEFRWRERAQELLRQLVNHIPEDAQLAYLGDVQVHQEIDGIRRALTRRQRARTPGATPSFGKPIPMPESMVMPPLAPQPANFQPVATNAQLPAQNLAGAIEQVLVVGSIEELQALVLRAPQLLSGEADEYLRQLSEQAFNQGDRETATALHEVRGSLANLRAGRTLGTPAPLSPSAAPDALPAMVVQDVPEPAYQALLQTASDPALIDAIRLFPVLLEPWADDLIGGRIEAALDEENERLATLIEERRDALAALRNMLFSDEALGGAILALLAAIDTDAIERALIEHPSLLTTVAQQALLSYAEAAQRRGDADSAAQAVERRVMLQQVRAGMID